MTEVIYKNEGCIPYSGKFSQSNTYFHKFHGYPNICEIFDSRNLQPLFQTSTATSGSCSTYTLGNCTIVFGGNNELI